MFKLAKAVMPSLLLTCVAAVAACNPPPKEATMRKAENPVSAAPADSPAEAEGRRTLSTAFVRLGAGEHLTVELRDGRSIVLRDMVMGPREYCGVLVAGGPAGRRYCGEYGDVAAARPGGAPAPGAPDPTILNPVDPGRSNSRRK